MTQDDAPPARDPAALFKRLRELREKHWKGARVTQAMVGEALGVSVPTLSGWESVQSSSTPPESRLRAYATLFATRRSLTNGKLRVLEEEELRDNERAERDRLLAELLELRLIALEEATAETPAAVPRHGRWYFPNVTPIRLVCGRLAADPESPDAYADPSGPYYTELRRFGDADAMVELFGHVRMENPSSDVRYRLAENLVADDLNSHLVLIGGVYFNPATRWIGGRIQLPVQQVEVPDVADGEIFEVEGKQQFRPEFRDGLGLVEDVGLFFRTRNPNNSTATLTICNGVFSRGVLGAVRCLTDRELRDQNEAYLARRFAGASSFGVLMRVPVLRGNAATPDLTNPDNVLFEWTA